ncbi:MAG: helix-turn-helix transcriptional regulator [Deltaproteobacteria bacterium]|nr:helix-turn-helix transcriptional regulator [Deltaproteobacteria bacterium]
MKDDLDRTIAERTKKNPDFPRLMRAARAELEKLDGALTFGRFLLGERTRAGLTQEEAGRTLGISRQMVCDIEKDRKFVSVELAAKLARTFGVSPTAALTTCLQDQVRRAGLRFTVTVETVASRKRA